MAEPAISFQDVTRRYPQKGGAGDVVPIAEDVDPHVDGLAHDPLDRIAAAVHRGKDILDDEAVVRMGRNPGTLPGTERLQLASH